MVATLDALIDKTDTFEIVRDQIAQILADNVAEQKNLATLQGEDPDLWNFRVFIERSDPWDDIGYAGAEPLVNVYFQSDQQDTSQGSHATQAHEGRFIVDAYVNAEATDQVTGQLLQDEQAARDVQRIMRLVRNILMAEMNTYLQLRTLVYGRVLETRSVFKPGPEDDMMLRYVMAGQQVFTVRFEEQSPQETFDTAELISVDVIRASDGRVLAECDYDVS